MAVERLFTSTFLETSPARRGKGWLSTSISGSFLGNGTGSEQAPVRKRRQLLTSLLLTFCVPYCRSECPSQRYVSLQCSRKLFFVFFLEHGLWGWDEGLSRTKGWNLSKEDGCSWDPSQ